MGETDENNAFDIRLRVGGEEICANGTVSPEPIPVRELLPVFRSFTDAIGGVTRRELEAARTPVSCAAGCGACCRQPVPIGHAEARHLAMVIEGMSPERQITIRDRFEAALDKLDEAGLLDKVRGYPEIHSSEDRQDLGLEYFRAWIDCPFLEDEMCSIHEDRPLACREYLVTSMAEHCSDPDPENVRMVKLPKKLSYLLYRFGDGMGKDEPRWIPLIFALEWTEEHADDDEPLYPGKPLFENFVQELSGR